MNSVLKILTELKKQKIAASAIEKELKFSNGLLGKAAKGTTALSAEKMEKFVKYYDLKIESLAQPANASAFDGSHVNLIKQDESLQFKEAYPPLPKGMEMLMIPKDVQPFPWIKLITDYCQGKGIVPEDLITFHKKYSNMKTGAAFTDEKGKVNKVIVNELKPAGTKVYDPFSNPRFKNKIGSKPE